MTLLEIAIAAALMAALMTVCVQMIRAVGGQQRAVARHNLASRTVQSLAELLGNTPWVALTAESAARIEIPPDVAAHLPNSQVSVTVVDEQEPTAAKRVTILLRWIGPSGQPARPVQLTTWIFPDDGPLK
jgi:hypothetical protein